MDIISKDILSLSGNDKVKIYGLKIGHLAIKKRSLNSKTPGVLSTLLSFRDKAFGEWLPVWAWIIVHPEGTFLIDTGLSSDVHQKGYFKKLDFVSRYYFEQQMKFDITREQEIDQQLEKIGIDAKSIDKIILTHLHIDHVGGLKHFPTVPILINEQEWVTKDGAFPALFPPSLNIQSLRLNEQYESFNKCRYLTKSKDLMLIHTPGHTRGHTSIALFSNENRIYFFGGDVAYTSKRLLNKAFSSTIQSHKENKESCQKIIELAKKRKVIFLPTHDMDNDQKLIQSEGIHV